MWLHLFPFSLPALLLLAGMGCNDYSFGKGDGNLAETGLFTPGDSASPGDSADNPGDSDDPGDPYDEDTGDPSGDPSDGPPGTILEGDCPEGTVATFDSDEIYVLSWDPTVATGVLSTDYSGWYNVYDYSIAESGSSQTNESAYFRITNAASSEGKPYWSNCEDEWVVQDADNDGFPSDSRIYIGTFWLEAGANTLYMYHYCVLYRDGYCPEFHITDDSSSTCDSDGANSVHFEGEGLCLVSAD